MLQGFGPVKPGGVLIGSQYGDAQSRGRYLAMNSSESFTFFLVRRFKADASICFLFAMRSVIRLISLLPAAISSSSRGVFI